MMERGCVKRANVMMVQTSVAIRCEVNEDEAMYSWKKDMDPNHGMPGHWVKLLRKTHEVSCRIAQSIRRTMDHPDGQNGSPGMNNSPSDRGRSFDGNIDGMRTEL